MKIKLTITSQVYLKVNVLEEKINAYLKKNCYRIIDKGPEFVTFVDDEFSDRMRIRSANIRIGEGKFEFYSNGEGSFIKLTYLTPILYPFLIIMAFIAVGLHVHSLIPILMSMAFTIPFGYRVYYLNEHVFKEILEG